MLFDITNDSPIVGLKTASLVTPLSSAVGKSSAAAKRTPGSGEALLRGQVKTLLQKVEEEAELSKLSLEARSFVHNIKGMLVNSPAGLLAPTPANTPQVSSLSGGLASLPPSPLVEEMIISQVTTTKLRWWIKIRLSFHGLLKENVQTSCVVWFDLFEVRMAYYINYCSGAVYYNLVTFLVST